MSTVHWLTHRGAVTGLVALGPDALLFSTTHPEDQPGAVHRLEPDKGALTSWPVAGGVQALVALGEGYALVNGARILMLGNGKAAPTPVGAPLPADAVALAPAFDGAVAVAAGDAVFVLGADGGVRQTLPLPAAATSLAASADGRWLMAGMVDGGLAAFSAEDADRFVAGDQAKVHDGAVRALAFEADALQVLSSGADGLIKRTHARGRLDAEDRGGRQGHAAVALLMAEARWYSVGGDGEVKAWPHKGKRPQGWHDGLRSATHATLASVRGRPHVALATQDHSLYLFLLQSDGKVASRAKVAHDGYQTARRGLRDERPVTRVKTLDTLLSYDDARAVELMAGAATSDGDVGVRVAAVQRLGRSRHPKAVPLLESGLRERSAAVREAVLAALRGLAPAGDVRPLRLALEAGSADIGVQAVDGLAAVAAAEPAGLQLLEGALAHGEQAVRLRALQALAGLRPKGDPGAELLALQAKHDDVRLEAVLRLHQGGLVGAPGVASALRRTLEHAVEVSAAAFGVLVLSVPALADALRALDPGLHQALHGIETHGDPKAKAPKKLRKPKKPPALTEAEKRPLLEALASRNLYSCVTGARGLALLGDPRALGALLQLSREADGKARAEACRALELLGDVRALPRLRQLLRDGDASVRDAAFTALGGLLGSDRLAKVDAGFGAPHDDVRRRALRSLLAPLRRGGALKPGGAEAARLAQALDDADAGLRAEAYKAALNIGVGGAEATQRFALGSRHADVRGEVLDELVAQLAEPWAWPLLLELLADPEPSVRKRAFEQARKKARGRSPRPATVALDSPYPDLRRLGAQTLAEKPDAAALARLAQATHDDDERVRLTALEALEQAGDDAALRAAADSPHPDVRVRAAGARASRGDATVAPALLAEIASTPPDEPTARAAWVIRVRLALDGLSDLEAAEATEGAVALLQAKEAGLRASAARCLGWVAPDAAPLLEALRHTDDAVKAEAALGLARLGDASGMGLFAAQAAAPEPAARSGGRRVAKRRATRRGASAPPAPPGPPNLEGAVALGDADRLTALLEHPEAKTREAALVVLVLWAWRRPDGAADRCLAALSTGAPGVRLRAAEALERLGDDAALAELAGQVVQAWCDGRARSAQAVAALADGLAAGGRFAARCVPALLAMPRWDDPTFGRRWGALTQRWADRFAAAAADRAAPAVAAGLDEVAFGAYAALSRLGDRGQAADSARRAALRRLAALADAGRASAEALAPVLLPALGDRAVVVRQVAFDALAAAGMAPQALAAEALATGFSDMGRAGLTLLVQGDGADGVAVLAQAVRERTDGLELVAYELLEGRVGPLEAARVGVAARADRVRQRHAMAALRGLANDGGEHTDGARALLLELAQAHDDDVVRVAAVARMAQQRDGAVLAPLTELLGRVDRRAQRQLADAAVALGSAEAAQALVARVAEDPAGTADGSTLLRAVARLRTGPVDGLLALLDRAEVARDAWRALKAIARADHGRPDDDDPVAQQDAEYAELEAREPLDDALVARLLTALRAPEHAQQAQGLMPAARWARDGAVDAGLARWAATGPDVVRVAALEAIGFRLRRRSGPPDPLLGALKLPEPAQAFEAAYGLAMAGRDDGLGVLLSAIELGEDLDQRRRAVEALGALGDLRALDPLITLVESEGHALQEPAAEALGRLADAGPARERAFPLLAKLAEHEAGWSRGGVAWRALRGLRWIGGADAWAIIRGRIEDDSWVIREVVSELLAHDPGEGADALLAKRLRDDDDWDVAQACARSLRARHGADSLAPDFAIARSGFDELEPKTVERLAAQASPTDLFALLGEVQDWDTYGEPLADAVRARASAADAVAALNALQLPVASLAAQVVGASEPDGAAGQAVPDALDAAVAAWRAARAKDEHDVDARAEQVARLLWAAGRQAVGDDQALALAEAGEAGDDARTVRRAALTALAEGLGGARALPVLQRAVTSPDSTARATAAAALAARDAKAAAKAAPALIDDAAALSWLVRPEVDVQGALRAGAQAAHNHGVVLPHLIAAGDVAGLAAVAEDRKAPEAARLGALEALARIPAQAAAPPLLAVAQQDDEEDALRKAAWRAVRRHRRALARAEVQR